MTASGFEKVAGMSAGIEPNFWLGVMATLGEWPSNAWLVQFGINDEHSLYHWREGSWRKLKTIRFLPSMGVPFAAWNGGLLDGTRSPIHMLTKDRDEEALAIPLPLRFVDTLWSFPDGTVVGYGRVTVGDPLNNKVVPTVVRWKGGRESAELQPVPYDEVPCDGYAWTGGPEDTVVFGALTTTWVTPCALRLGKAGWYRVELPDVAGSVEAFAMEGTVAEWVAIAAPGTRTYSVWRRSARAWEKVNFPVPTLAGGQPRAFDWVSLQAFGLGDVWVTAHYRTHPEDMEDRGSRALFHTRPLRGRPMLLRNDP